MIFDLSCYFWNTFPAITDWIKVETQMFLQATIDFYDF